MDTPKSPAEQAGEQPKPVPQTTPPASTATTCTAANEQVQGLIQATKASLVDYFCSGWRKPYFLWIEKEWNGMLAGKVLFIFLALILIGLTALFCTKVNRHFADQKVRDIQEKNSISNAFLLGTINMNREEMQKLTAERDKFEIEAQNAQNALAPWVQLANSQFTNTPVTKRLDKLFDAVSASVGAYTNLLTSVNSQVPTLSLTISNANMLSWTDGMGMMFRCVIRSELDG